jgi:hypothetical protein
MPSVANRSPLERDRLTARDAEATGEDIIDPRVTREVLCELVEDAQQYF